MSWISASDPSPLPTTTETHACRICNHPDRSRFRLAGRNSRAGSSLTPRPRPDAPGWWATTGGGKSTLLRLIAGDLTPTVGQVKVAVDVAYLPQTLTLDVDASIAGVLGVGAKLAALRAIEAGSTSERHFEILGEDWDVEDRAGDALRAIGLDTEHLDRTVGQVSGEEAMLVALSARRWQRASITLLDEPTNNLDRDARARLCGPARRLAGHLGGRQPRRRPARPDGQHGRTARPPAHHLRGTVSRVACPSGAAAGRRRAGHGREPTSRRSAWRSVSGWRPR